MSGWFRRMFGSESQEPWKWQELADYNARVVRGIKHEAHYVERMREQQRQFDIETYGKARMDIARTYRR